MTAEPIATSAPQCDLGRKMTTCPGAVPHHSAHPVNRSRMGGDQAVSGRSDFSSQRHGSAAASSGRSEVSPEVARLFEMADRKAAGWLSVGDIQVLRSHYPQLSSDNHVI